MSSQRIKNPIVRLEAEENGVLLGDSVIVSLAGRNNARVKFRGNTIVVMKDRDSKAVSLYAPGGKECTFRSKGTQTIPLGTEYLKISVNSDFVVPDIGGRFLGFICHSIWLHVVLALAFAALLSVMPKVRMVKKTSVTTKMDRIKKIMKKVALKKAPKIKKIVKKIALVKPKPKKKIVKAKKPRPKKKIVKKRRVLKSRPVAKRKVVRPRPKRFVKKTPKIKVVRKVVRAGPTRAQILAKKQAAIKAANLRRKQMETKKLAKSLNFLSSSKGTQTANTARYKKAKVYNHTVAVPTQNQNSKALNRMASSTNSGQIETSNARTISTGSAFKGAAYGKALNGVHGRVANAGVSGSTDMSAALNMGGKLTMAGAGDIKSSLIKKILAKNVDKLRYCYEKALLSDPGLQGNITMKWTIRVGGKVSKVKIVRSQMKNGALHRCISTQIARIRFPNPSGGSVDINYPFSFSSTSI